MSHWPAQATQPSSRGGGHPGAGPLAINLVPNLRQTCTRSRQTRKSVPLCASLCAVQDAQADDSATDSQLSAQPSTGSASAGADSLSERSSLELELFSSTASAHSTSGWPTRGSELAGLVADSAFPQEVSADAEHLSSVAQDAAQRAEPLDADAVLQRFTNGRRQQLSQPVQTPTHSLLVRLQALNCSAPLVLPQPRQRSAQV